MDVRNIRLETGTIIKDKKLKKDFMLLPDVAIEVNVSEWCEMDKMFGSQMQDHIVSLYYQTLLDMKTFKAEKKNLLLDRYELGEQLHEKEKDVFFTKMLMQGIKINRDFTFPTVYYTDIRTMKPEDSVSFFDDFLIKQKRDFFLSSDLKICSSNLNLILKKKSSLYLFQTVLVLDNKYYLLNEREIDTTKTYTTEFEKLLINVIKNNFLKCYAIKPLKYSPFSYKLSGKEETYRNLDRIIKIYGRYLDAVTGKKRYGNYEPNEKVKVDVLGLIKADEKTLKSNIHDILLPEVNDRIKCLYVDISSCSFQVNITGEMEEYFISGIYEQIKKRLKPYPNRSIAVYVKNSGKTPGLSIIPDDGSYYVNALAYPFLFYTSKYYFTEYDNMIETMYNDINTSKKSREMLIRNHFKEFKWFI